MTRAPVTACLLALAACSPLDPFPLPSPAATAPPSPLAPPPIPVGLDAYRQWERLPYVRIGERAIMRSTYDRTGGNEAADASHFLRQDAEDRNVVLDLEGPGVLSFVRTNHWHGSPWHYVVNGADHVVSETSTADPDHPAPGSIFLPSAALPSPLTFTWSTTQGADLNWVPIPFEKTFSLAYERTHYGTGYFIVHQLPPGADNPLGPIQAWDESPPDPAVLQWLAEPAADFAPSGAGVATDSGAVDIPASGAVVAFDTGGGPRLVRALRLRAAEASAVALGHASIRVTWDGRAEASIEAPVGLFFGAGSLYNRSGAVDLVRAKLASVRFDAGEVELTMIYPMPFFERARLELVGAGEAVPGVTWELVTEPFSGARGQVGYFHATYRDHGVPVPGQDLVLLDTTQAEGGGDWCGHFAGTSFIFSDAAVYSTLEGDPRFFFDDSRSPQGYGTGTEEWGGGGDYWGGQTMTLPLAGHPVGAPSAAAAQGDEDRIESAYRFLVADVMPFGKNARIQLEHGGLDDSTEHYRTVAYWYGRPGACLVQTDALHVGDAADEMAHAYVSPDASDVETLTSRFELGVDHVGAVEAYPAITDTGRHTTGESEFTLRVDPDNLGVLLRRALDYGFPDQRAEVFVAGPEPGATFEPAGVWYLAGSNTCLYSDPPGELDATQHLIETSNRRFREDELLLPPALTRGRASIRVRIRHAPRSLALFPGAQAVPRAWSEYRYWAYSYVLPATP